jgi:hypothetical protein
MANHRNLFRQCLRHEELSARTGQTDGRRCRRRFDVLVVWRFDRFARSVSHLLRALEQSQSLGIDFVSLSENVDTSAPTGKMIFHRSWRRGRTGAQPDRRTGQGRHSQRPCAREKAGTPWGRCPGIPDRRSSCIWASWRAIAQEMGVGVGTVHRIGQRRSKNACEAFPEGKPGGALCHSELPT